MIVPLQDEHVLALGERLPHSARGFAVVEDGKVLGVAGAYRAINAQAVFLRVTDELRRHPVTMVRLAKKMLGLPGRYVVAKCDESIPGARRFLEHFGFQEQGNGIWTLLR